MKILIFLNSISSDISATLQLLQFEFTRETAAVGVVSLALRE